MTCTSKSDIWQRFPKMTNWPDSEEGCEDYHEFYHEMQKWRKEAEHLYYNLEEAAAGRAKHILELTEELRKAEAQFNEANKKLNLERLASLEHEQWIAWNKGLVKEYQKPDLWIPYAKLSEQMKEKDRFWARKILEA